MQPYADGMYIVKPGDTMSLIAREFLGSATRYPEIAEINRHIANPNRIYPGDFLFIPSQRKFCTFDSFPVSNVDWADMKKTADQFRSMSHRHQEALTSYPAETTLLVGVLNEMDARQGYDHLLTGAASVKNVAYAVRQNIEVVGKTFVAEMQQLHRQFPNLRWSNPETGKLIQDVIDSSSDNLASKTGGTFRDVMMDGVIDHRGLKKFVRGQGEMPMRFPELLSNTEKWLKRLENVGTVLVALDFGGALYDCIEDLRDQDGANNLRQCATSFAGFAGGTYVGSLGGMLVGGLSLGGLPLVGATLAVAGVGVASGYLGKYGIGLLYDLVN